MAGSVNKVILIGNLGKDPDVRHFENGGSVASFPIATTESYKNRERRRCVLSEQKGNVNVLTKERFCNLIISHYVILFTG